MGNLAAILLISTLMLGTALGAALWWVFWHGRLAQVRRSAVVLLKSTAEQASQHYMRVVDKRGRHCRAQLERSAQETDEERAELELFAAEMAAREKFLEARELDLAALNTNLIADELTLTEQTARLHRQSEECQRLVARCDKALLQRAAVQRESLCQDIETERLEQAALDSKKRAHYWHEQLCANAPQESRRLLAVAVHRYDGVGHLERIQSTIHIEHPEVFDRLVDADGPCHRALVETVGCELHGDGQARSITVRGDDPLAREIGRRALFSIAEQRLCNPNAIRTLASSIKSTLNEEIAIAAAEAVRLLELEPPHADIMHLIGRLKYRLSYSQNQWKHAIEVAHLANTFAVEMGLNPVLARRGGLLHDIGKAMTHDHEGSHAVLGAQVARRSGECEIVANAIGSHHNDEPAQSPIAHIVTAADAMSGARPGARRDSDTNYLQILKDIQRIASRSQAVQRVDIMQAGREVRVIVGGAAQGEVPEAERPKGSVLTGSDMHALALNIAHSIEEEVVFAGQIRVTVIQESKAVSVAR